MSDADRSVQRGLQPHEMAAVRQLFSKLDPEHDQEEEFDIIQSARNIKREWDRREKQLNRMANTITDLSDQVEDLSASLEGDSYDGLTREQKRLRVKRLLQNKAKERGGKASIDYNDVRAAFSHEIPLSSTHYLMESIGEESGYRYREHGEKNNTLVVDLPETETDLFSSEKP